jgi:hypothetical protein
VAKFHQVPTELKTEWKESLGLGVVIRHDLSCIVGLV